MLSARPREIGWICTPSQPRTTEPVSFNEVMMCSAVEAGIAKAIPTLPPEGEKIASLNSRATLPSDPITVFFRSDESGTTENTAKFLATAGGWKDEPSKSWTGTGEGKNKSSGVAEAVTSTKNSISYMEWSFAKDNNLAMAQLDSGSGAVELTGDAVGMAVAEAKVKGSGSDLSLDLKYADNAAGAYPALLVTYEIVCSKGVAADKTAIIKDFLGYFAAPETQASLEELGYAPLPTELQTKVKTAIEAIA